MVMVGDMVAMIGRHRHAGLGALAADIPKIAVLTGDYSIPWPIVLARGFIRPAYRIRMLVATPIRSHP